MNAKDRVVLELKIRSLIEDKAMITAQANRDMQLGEWRCDYATWHGQIDCEIRGLFSKLDEVTK